MEGMETGLRHRLKRVLRQMSDQHRHLRAIHVELAGALSGSGASDTRGPFEQYRQALEAHFALESETFFPAVHGLRADWTPVLEELDRAHERFRELLRDIRELIEAGSIGAAARELAAFTAELRDHEVQEEQLLAGLDEEVAREPGSRGD